MSNSKKSSIEEPDQELPKLFAIMKADSERILNLHKSNSNFKITVSADLYFSAKRFARVFGHVRVITNHYLPLNTWILEDDNE